MQRIQVKSLTEKIGLSHRINLFLISKKIDKTIKVNIFTRISVLVYLEIGQVTRSQVMRNPFKIFNKRTIFFKKIHS